MFSSLSYSCDGNVVRGSVEHRRIVVDIFDENFERANVFELRAAFVRGFDCHVDQLLTVRFIAVEDLERRNGIIE